MSFRAVVVIERTGPDGSPVQVEQRARKRGTRRAAQKELRTWLGLLHGGNVPVISAGVQDSEARVLVETSRKTPATPDRGVGLYLPNSVVEEIAKERGIDIRKTQKPEGSRLVMPWE